MGSLLRLYPRARLYVLDSKFAGDFDGWPGTIQTEFDRPAKPQGNQRIQVWQPIHIVPDSVESWLASILKDAPAILYIDELVHLIYKKNQPSLAYSKLLKVGRALPVGCVTCTQELAEIPRSTIGQTTHVARFRLLRDWDRRVIDSVSGSPGRLVEPPDPHGFYYASMRDTGKIEYFWNSQAFF